MDDLEPTKEIPSSDEIKMMEFEHKRFMDLKRLDMEKVDMLETMITSTSPFDSGMPGTESKYLPTFSDRNREEMENLIMKLIKKIC